MANDQKFFIDNIKRKVIINGRLLNGPNFVETNSSFILLSDDRAFKILKESKTGVDCSTFLSRGDLLREEMQINSETSPGLYFGVMPVSLDRGKIVIGSENSAAIEYALCMKKLHQNSLVYNMLLNGVYSEEYSALIAKKIADFHKVKLSGRVNENDRELIKKFGTIKSFTDVIKEDFTVFEKMRISFSAAAVAEQKYREIKKHILKFLKEKKELLLRRIMSGYVFPIHGDFHSRNIFIEDGIVYAIDRSLKRKMRVSDTVKDLAYLAIDLEVLGPEGQKELFLNEYNFIVKDQHLTQLLPFYMCRQAFVAGIVNLSRGDIKRFNAYFNIAYKYANDF